MATTVGALSVDLDLNSASFINNMKKAVDSVDKSSKAMSSSLTFAKSALTTFVAGFTADKIGQMAAKGLEFASSLGEQAQQLGVSTRELQVYRFAASQVGLSNEEMDAGLAKLTLRIGQAAAGNDKLRTVFSSLGIAITDSAGNARSAGDVMEDLAGKLSKVEDPAKRAQIEVALFGKAGQKLDTLLTGAGGTIDELSNAADRLGIVLSDDMIRRADDAADKMSAVKQVLSTKIAFAVADNANAILKLADALQWAAEKAGQFFKTMEGVKRIQRDQGFLRGFFSGFGEQLTASDPTKYVKQRSDELAAAQKKLREAQAAPIGKDYFGFGRKRIADAQAEVAEATRLYKAALADPEYIAARAAAITPPALPKPAAAPLPSSAKGKSGGGRSSPAKTLDDELASLERTLDPAKAANLEFEKNIEILRKAADQGKITAQRYSELHDALFANWQREGDTALDRAPVALDRMDQAITVALPKIEDLQVQLQKVPSAIDEAFADANIAGMEAFIGSVENLRRGFGSLKDVALNVLDAIETAILNKLVYGPLMDWASGKSASGGGLLGGLFSAAGSLFGSIFGGRRALGGRVSAGRAYLVGEQGPEPFIPDSAGTIIPSAAMNAAGEGSRGGNTYQISGNLLTPEFWQQIQAMDAASAQAGSDLAMQRMTRQSMRSLSR